MITEMESLEGLLNDRRFTQFLIIGASQANRGYLTGFCAYRDLAGKHQMEMVHGDSECYGFDDNDRLVEDIIVEACFENAEDHNLATKITYKRPSDEIQSILKENYWGQFFDDPQIIHIHAAPSVWVPREKNEKFVEGDTGSGIESAPILAGRYLKALRDLGEGKVYLRAFQGIENETKAEEFFSYGLLTGKYNGLENLKKLDLNRLKQDD